MWSELTTVGGVTNTVTLPDAGMVSLTIPKGVELCAYVNGEAAPMHHIHVNAGDNLYFELAGHEAVPATIEVLYNGSQHIFNVTPTDKATLTTSSMSLGIEPLTDRRTTVVPNLSTTERITSTEEYLVKKGHSMTPSETVNLFAGMGQGGAGAGMGAGAGAGLGAGLLGGILGSALLGHNRNGLLGGDSGGVVAPNFVTNTELQTALNAQSANQNTNTIMDKLGTIEAAIPFNEGQVQLALAGSVAALNAQINTSTAAVVGAINDSDNHTQNSIATTLAAQGEIRRDIANGNTANAAWFGQLGNQVLTSTYQTALAINNDGEKTRALLIAQNESNLQRQLTVAESALFDHRAASRSRDVEVNVTQQVTQNQAQMQAQAQQQQQFQITNNLLQALLAQGQIAQASNQSLIIGNSGYTRGGDQSANPVNVRA